MDYRKNLDISLCLPSGSEIPLNAEACFYYQPGEPETFGKPQVPEAVELQSVTVEGLGDITKLLSKRHKHELEVDELYEIRHQRGAA